MLDEDLADLYGVETKRLIQQVKRNLKRFPGDFMFQLTKAEAEALRSQIATSNDGRGGRLAGSFQELQKRLDQMELDISEHDKQLARSSTCCGN